MVALLTALSALSACGAPVLRMPTPPTLSYAPPPTLRVPEPERIHEAQPDTDRTDVAVAREARFVRQDVLAILPDLDPALVVEQMAARSQSDAIRGLRAALRSRNT